MEQWQFLIQKEGERIWHPLKKPRIEIVEGKYRVVARSHLANTDVEVRVTHSSSNEIPPRRRIQKRRRRTNSEGLTAVIPFTYLKSGIWELQCSGDLMSDLLGASWQYGVILEVISSPVEKKIEKKAGSPTRVSGKLEKQHQVGSKQIIKPKPANPNPQNTQSKNYSSSSNNLKTNEAGLISSISIENVTRENAANQTAKTKLGLDKNKTVKEKPANKLEISSKAAADKQKSHEKATPKANQKSLTTANKAVSQKQVERLQKSQKSLPKSSPQKAIAAQLSEHQTDSKVSAEKSSKKILSAELSAPQNTEYSEKITDETPEKSLTTQNQEPKEKPNQTQNLAIIEQTANPVSVKGDTAEQILQNLIDLALPATETLLNDEATQDIPLAPPLPLSITLDKVNYVARWGETITVEGIVQPKETATEQNKQIYQAEVRIELRSPQNSQLLQSVRKPNPNRSLPFAIATSIEIPPKCSSKLILAEVQLYGSLSSNGSVEILASQSFTITADITELLAITVADPKGELDRIAASSEEYLIRHHASQALEPAVSLDLQLFNLAKTAKRKSISGIPSTKKSLPLNVEPRKYRRRFANQPRLPSVPGYREKIDEYINNGNIGFSSSGSRSTSFPYLRKLKSLPISQVEVDESNYVNATKNQDVAEAKVETPVNPSTQINNTSQAELVVDQPLIDIDNSFEFEEPITPRNSEFIASEYPNTSPLIRQWMLSQGYTLPEPIDVEYEDYDIYAENQQISQQQASLSSTTQNQEKSQLLNSEQAQNIQLKSSPYLSISTSSGWETNQTTTPSTQIAQEIVVDDTDIFADNILEASSYEPNEAIDSKIDHSSTTAITISTQKIEQLPIPQLYIPSRELVSGKSISVRVLLPQGNSHLAVKLWVEDCHTRSLLDGPHLLTNLTPNNKQELEVITKLNIPFGCIEIRLEAIAINQATQQESHKFTIQRTVIPPDLPNIQYDAILGM